MSETTGSDPHIAGRSAHRRGSIAPFGATGNFSSNAAVVSVTRFAVTTLLSFSSSSNFPLIAVSFEIGEFRLHSG